MMNEKTKRELLESIIRSEKILNAFEKYRSSYKLNKKLMIERIVEELDNLWERFKDIPKLKKFLETFLSNHIKDFLIKNRSPSSRSDSISVQQDQRVDVDPNERLQRELEERKKLNITLPMKNSSDLDETTEPFINEENMEEKNESFDKDMSHRNQQMNQGNQQMNQGMYSQMNPNPNMIPQQPQMMQQPQQQQQMQQSFTPQMQQQLQQLQQLQQQLQHQLQQQPQQMNRMNPQQFPNQSLPNQPLPNQPLPNQPLPNQPLPNQQFGNQQFPNQQFPNQQLANQPLPNQPLPNQQLPNQKQYMRRLDVPQENHTTHLKQKTIDEPPKQQPLPVPVPQPLVQQAAPPPVVQPQAALQQPAQHKEVQERSLIDRSVIHIDSRERNLQEHPKSNPFSIEMSDDMTCLIMIRDMIVSNVTNDPYLLVQISEYKNSLYENQLNRDIHYKMVRKHKDEQFSYYENTDPETMIRLRNISRITFQVIRPNGKLLYSSVQDVCDVTKVYTEEEKTEYVESVSSLEQLDQKKVEVLELALDHLNLHDTLTLFDDAVEKGDEAQIIHMDRKNKKIVVEYMDGKSSTGYQKIMIHKYQLSISLEII